MWQEGDDVNEVLAYYAEEEVPPTPVSLMSLLQVSSWSQCLQDDKDQMVARGYKVHRVGVHAVLQMGEGRRQG